MKKIITLWAFLLFFVDLAKSQNAQFTTDGSGQFRNYIAWIDWRNATISNGFSRSFSSPDGTTYTVSLTNVTGTFTPTRMQTWTPSVFWQMYDFRNMGSQPMPLPALFNQPPSPNTPTVGFTLTISASRNGSPVPFTLVATDAEASSDREFTQLATSGSAWQSIEFARINSMQTSNPLQGCNTQSVTISDTWGGSVTDTRGQNPIISTTASSGTLTVTTTMSRTTWGDMAVAFGILSPIDKGDLPSSYGMPTHAVRITSINTCSTIPPPSFSINNSLMFGGRPGDPDVFDYFNDNTLGRDEDGTTEAAFAQYNGSGTYSITLSLNNSTGNTAWVSGWFDYNRDGIFSIGERTSNSIPNNASSYTFTWSGLPSILPSGTATEYGFRFRIGSVMSEVLAPTGLAIDGEVEDYKVAADSFSTPLCPEECDWTLTGNIIDAYRFIGPRNNEDFRIRTNNIQRVVVKNNGNFGIGTTAPTAQLHTTSTVRHENIPYGTGAPLVVDANGNVFKAYCNFYCEIEPVRVKQMEEYEERIRKLESQLQELSRKMNGDVKQNLILEQNIPNPFSNSTSFEYYVPVSVKRASLVIYTLDGRQVSSKMLPGTGKGILTMQTTELSAGMYLAAIVANTGETSQPVKIVISR